ncbi:MAG: DNA-binding protein [Pseudomonas sp.]
MARGGINKALVHQARQALLARGKHPSIDALRIELGNTGSKTTIQRYQKELEEADAGDSTSAQPLSEQLTTLVVQLAEHLQSEAQETVAQAHERWALERSQYAEAMHHAETSIQQLDAQAKTLEGDLDKERQTRQQTQEQLQQAQLEQARLLQARHDLDARLVDRDEQVRSLEEKHQHARDALEHYRQASKEQREQEQRRHETQVQQLQMELRQLQQTLIVKQDDITQLNRDNERFITEARLQLKDLSNQRDRLERQTGELLALNVQLTQSHATQEMLQERLTAVQAQSGELQKTVSRQNQRAQSLQGRLAEAKTALNLLRQARKAADLESSPSDAVI